MDFFQKGDSHKTIDYALEEILNIDNTNLHFDNKYSIKVIEDYKLVLDYLSNNVIIDIDIKNMSIIDFHLNRLKNKIQQLEFTNRYSFDNESSEKNKTLLNTLDLLINKFLKRKELLSKQVGLPSCEEDLINSSSSKSSLEILKEIGFYDHMVKKYVNQNPLKIIAILGRDDTYNVEIIKKQTLYFAFCYHIGLIDYLTEYFIKINNKGVDKKIGQLLSNLSNFKSKNTTTNFRRNYKEMNDSNSRYYALKKENIEYVSGLLKLC